MKNRQITIDLNEILDLISSSEHYGTTSHVFMSFWAKQLGYLEEQEIESFAQLVSSSELYNAEDYCEIKNKLKDFKNEYFQ